VFHGYSYKVRKKPASNKTVPKMPGRRAFFGQVKKTSPCHWFCFRPFFLRSLPSLHFRHFFRFATKDPKMAGSLIVRRAVGRAN
jgi:hypothetical protein